MTVQYGTSQASKIFGYSIADHLQFGELRDLTSDLGASLDVFGKGETLAKDVVIIGGGETGCDTAMHLAEKGHNVTVLEQAKVLAPTAQRVHFDTMYNEAWEKHKNCKAILEALCNGITDDGATYIDARRCTTPKTTISNGRRTLTPTA